MRNLEVALCDCCEDYILKFASYLMSNVDASIHIFTTTESFFSDEGCYDVAIMSEDFKEVSEFRPKGEVKRKYFLCEEPDVEDEDYIYKYQSIDNVLGKITELRKQKGVSASIKKSNGNSKFIGVYSPVDHELQLPFSMALGQGYRTGGKVLFLDLEEISIMPDLIGSEMERNLLDLLYEINTSASDFDINTYVRNFMGFDFIQPFRNPNELCEIEAETWNLLFDVLAKSDYDVIVVLFGRTINGFISILQRFEHLYVLGKPGDYFKKGQEAFMEYLERINAEVDRESVILPMSAGNLTDGTYQIQELMQGNLGVFVKKLISTKVKNAIECYR